VGSGFQLTGGKISISAILIKLVIGGLGGGVLPERTWRQLGRPQKNTFARALLSLWLISLGIQLWLERRPNNEVTVTSFTNSKQEQGLLACVVFY